MSTVTAPPIRIPVCGRDASAAEQYALLTTIRAFEQTLLDLFATGALSGTTHTCLGQETIAAGVMSAIDRERDIVFSNHRGHGHFLAYCGEVERLFLEILGRPGGVCGGRGGSQHLQFRNFYSNGVQGGIVPVTAGMALAEKLNGSKAVSIVFLGDGTLGEGAVYEAFNIASLWRLPMVFVIEHNGYAQSTPASLQIAGEVAERPRAFGIATEECESTATADVLAYCARAIDSVRNTGGPRCCVFYSTRLGPHSKGDDTRSADEMKTAWAFDPLKAARAALDPKAAEQLDRQAADLMAALRARAGEHL